MNNNFFKELARAMNKIEKDSIRHIYIISPDIEAKAYRLFSDFLSSGVTARLDCNPAYSQITVIADTYVLSVNKQVHKANLLCADIICIDSAIDGKLHIECSFNNAFAKVGEINE